jgi:hypothetical protein
LRPAFSIRFGDFRGVFLFLRKVRQHDVGPFPGEGDRRRCADAGVRTRDDCLPAVEAARAAVGVLAQIGLGFKLGVQAGLGLVLLGRLNVLVSGDRVLEGVLVGHGSPPTGQRPSPKR